MTKRIRLLAVGMTLAASSFAAVAVPTGSASAAGICTSYRDMVANVAKLCTGPAGGGPFQLQALGSYNGVSKYMFIKVCRIAADGSRSSTCWSDAGMFYSYAGPLDVSLARYYIKGTMNNTSGQQVYNSGWLRVDN